MQINSPLRYVPSLLLFVSTVVAFTALNAQESNYTPAQQAQLEEANRLVADLVKLHKLGNFRDALAPAKKSLEIRLAILGENHPDTATSLSDLGTLFQALGDYATARRYHEQTLQIRRKVLGEEHLTTVGALNNLGLVIQAQGNYAAARPYHEQALKISKKVLGEAHPATAASFSNLGALSHAQGDYEAARPYLEEAFKIYKKANGELHSRTAHSLNNLGYLLRTQGDYAAARPYYEQALLIYKKVSGDEHPDTANSYNNLATLLHAQGDYPAARPHLEQALKIRRKILGEEHPVTATSFANLGFILRAQGDYANALAYYEHALKINKKVLGEEHVSIAPSHDNIGAILQTQGHYAAARPHFEQSLKVYKKALGEENPRIAISLSNLGWLLLAQGDHANARPYLEQTLKISKKVLGEEHPDSATALINLAILENISGNRTAAAHLMDQSRHSASRHIARTLPVLSEKEQALYFQANEQHKFHVALSLAHRHRTDAQVVEQSAGWVLNGKAVAQEALAQRNLLTRDVKSPAMAEAIQKLIGMRRQLANLAMSAPQKGQEQTRQQAIESLTAQEATLTRDVAQKTSRPELTGDPWVAVETVRKALPLGTILLEIARFKEFQFTAKESEQWGAARYAAWVIPDAGEGVVQFVDLGEANAIEKAVADVVQGITDAGKPTGLLATADAATAEQRIEAAMTRATELIWKPLASKLTTSSKRIILSPDGNLWLLPWAALPIPSDKDKKLLLENHVVQLEVSGRELVKPRAKISNVGLPTMFADPDYDLSPAAARQSIQTLFPKLDLNDNAGGTVSQSAFTNVPRLPNTAVEAEAVAPNLKVIAQSEPQKYMGPWAMETVLKRVDRPKILMLSTHGFFLADQEVDRSDLDIRLANTDNRRSAALLAADGKPVENPLLRCGLLFAGCNSQQSVGGEDGILTGMEVVSLDLRGTELVVLSACETGTGQVRNGQGIAGLRQAFQLAGAESVVATLWQVPDRDSAIIMNDFFENLANGQPRPEALRNAQLKRIEKRKDRDGAAHPFYWAAWTITGH